MRRAAFTLPFPSIRRTACCNSASLLMRTTLGWWISQFRRAPRPQSTQHRPPRTAARAAQLAGPTMMRKAKHGKRDGAAADASGSNLTFESLNGFPSGSLLQVWRMRTGISITLKPADRRRLATLARDRNAPHKHVWRAEIVLLSADGVGTNEIMRRTGKSKTCVWRWQERFMQAGYDGLLHDKTRPSRIPPLGSDLVERVVMLTQTDPPAEATHWTATMMAKAVGISAVPSNASGARMVSNRTGSGSSSSPTTRSLSTSCAMSSGFMSIRPPMPSSFRSMRSRKSKPSTAPSPACR